MGHTHENVDQMFSKVNKKLKESNTVSPASLEQALWDSFPNMLSVGEMTSVIDFKKFISHTHSKIDIHYHSGYHQFKITNTVEGSTKLSDIRLL